MMPTTKATVIRRIVSMRRRVAITIITRYMTIATAPTLRITNSESSHFLVTSFEVLLHSVGYCLSKW